MSVKKNVIANYLGRGWGAVAAFLFIPFYIQFLGIEAYGVIGFFASLMAALTLLDFGMGQTLVREAARTSESEVEKSALTGLLGTLEYVYWGVGALAAVTIWFLSGWFARDWLSAQELSHSDLALIVQIMGFVAATRWAASPYRSSLIGLQNQVWLNVYEATFVTIRGVGAIAVLAWISETVLAFFIYQGLISIIDIICLRLKVWHLISGNRFVVPHFDLKQLKRIGRFAGGVATISLLGSGISQLDKLLLPGLVSLKMFGYYMVAHTLGRAIVQLSFPVATAYRPLFAKLVANKQDAELSNQYHKASQLMAVSLIPAAIVIAVFSEQLLWLWTNNREIVDEASSLVSLITIGTMLNGLVNIPYSVQLAYGYLKLGLIVNFVSAILLMPAFYFGVINYGVIAAGWIWLVLNLSYVLVNVSIMHRHYLPKQAVRWYMQDILPVIGGVCIVVIGFEQFLPSFESKWFIALKIVFASIAAVAVASVMANYIRHYFINRLSQLMKLKEG